MIFTPEDWLARLAALVPRPRAHLTRYHGVFAPSGAVTFRHRRAQAPSVRLPVLNDDGLPMAPLTWAERLRRVFRIDITTCPECGGRLRWIAMDVY